MSALPLTEEPMTTGGPSRRVRLRPFAGESDLPRLRGHLPGGQPGRSDRGAHDAGGDGQLGRPPVARRSEADRDIVVATRRWQPIAYGWTTLGRHDRRRARLLDPRPRPPGLAAARHRHRHPAAQRGAHAGPCRGHETDRPRVYIRPSPRNGGLGPWPCWRATATSRCATSSTWCVRPWMTSACRSCRQGIEIRPVAGRGQLRQLFDADVEAFADHWGGFDASDASFEQWLSDPDYDPALFVVAWDGDQIAGAVANVIQARRTRSWAGGEACSTASSCAGRGVAAGWARRWSAAACSCCASKGMDSAWLGVDADNPTGRCACTRTPASWSTSGRPAYRKPLEVNR